MMKVKNNFDNIKKSLCFTLIALIFLSCGKQLGSQDESQFQAIELTSEVSFDDLFSTVLGPKCIQCHSWAQSEQELLQYVKKGEPEQSKLYQVVENNSMPLGGPILSDIEKVVVYDYISNLSVSDVTPVPSKPDTNPRRDTSPSEPPTHEPDLGYDQALLKQIMDNTLVPKCISCHAWIGDKEQVLSRVKAQAPLESRLYLRVENDSMPLFGEKLSAIEKDSIKEFIETMTLNK